MQEHVTPQGVTFPVDLTREEYVYYYMLLARTAGPLRGRRVQIGLLGGFFVLIAALGVADLLQYGKILDWGSLALALGMLVLGMVLWLLIPGRTRRQAQQAYDRMVDSGYSFYGTVEVRPTELVKVGEELTTAVPFNANALFIEDKEALVLTARQGRAIVLPARCLTAETAAAVRTAAERLPTANRRFVSRLVPGCQPVQAPTVTPTVTLWERQLRYTPQEYVAIAKARLLAQYGHRLPLTAVLCVVIALAFAWPQDSILPTVLAFLVAMVLQTLLGLVLPLSRLSRLSPVGEAALTVTVTFTDRGVKLRSGEEFASFPWTAVQHVYDRGDYAELLYEKQFLRIPKREIEDLEAFDGLLKTYWHYNK